MKIAKEVYNAHRKLSGCSAAFLDFVKKNPESLVRKNFNNILLDKRFDYYNWQPWPTFINKRTREELEDAVVKLHGLITGIPERLFNFDFRGISKYYEIPENVTRVLLQGVDANYLRFLLGRGDFILSPNDGLKILEFNMQANVGGWELSIMEPLFLDNPIISKFIKGNNFQVRKSKLFTILMDHMVGRALDHFSANGDTDGEINMGFILPRFIAARVHAVESRLRETFTSALRRKNPDLKGELILCDLFKLKEVDGYVMHGEKKIHVLVEMCNGVVPLMLMDAVKAGNLLLYNGPVTRIMSNKLNLALLSEHVDSDKFTSAEREVIKKYVPWTRKVIPGHVTYAGDQIKLKDFAAANKERFVLKPSEGLGGEDVYPGRYTSPQQWEHVLEKALREKKWVIQEYVESHPYMYQSNETDCLEHNLVWGIFAFGPHYGEGENRVLPGKNEKGVINTYLGAELSPIVEVEE